MGSLRSAEQTRAMLSGFRRVEFWGCTARFGGHGAFARRVARGGSEQGSGEARGEAAQGRKEPGPVDRGPVRGDDELQSAG